MNTSTWRGTHALLRGAVAGAGLVTAGVVLGRVDLVVLGAPLLLATVTALAVVPRGRPELTVAPPPLTATAGEAVATTVTIDGGVGAELIAVRLPVAGVDGLGAVHLLPGPRRTIRVRPARDTWGEGIDLRPDHLVAGPDALLVSGPVVGTELRRTLLPPVLTAPPGPLQPRLSGLVGVHRSPRPGDGAELRRIRPFQAGDRVRRVDWRVSLRAGAAQEEVLGPRSLSVREYHAEADADLLLVLDERYDPSAAVAEWASAPSGTRVRPAGSVDVAVRALGSLAAAFLRQGDRVGLAVLGHPQLGLTPGVGRRQLLRIRHQLARSAESAGRGGRPAALDRRLPAGAVVVMASAFLDDAVADLTVQTARRGHLVVALDVLPQRLVPDPDVAWGAAACAVLRAEQRMRLRALRAHGVPVLGGGDAGQLGAVLHRLRAPAGARVRR